MIKRVTKAVADDVSRLALLLGVFVIIGMLIYVIVDIYATPPAIRFDHTEVAPVGTTTYCAGDTITYPFVFTVTHGPVLIGHRRVVWNVDRPGTDQFATIIEWGIYQKGERVVQELDYQLPAVLPPGRHELRIASSETARSTGYMFVPFEVLPPDQCGVQP